MANVLQSDSESLDHNISAVEVSTCSLYGIRHTECGLMLKGMAEVRHWPFTEEEEAVVETMIVVTTDTAVVGGRERFRSFLFLFLKQKIK